MRRIEKIAIEELGIPSILLMENAAIRLAEHCMRALAGHKNPKMMIISGPGSNGGDGFALARLMHIKGVDTGVIFVGDMGSVKDDAATYLEIIRKLGVPIEPIPLNDNLLDVPYTIETCDLIVDAMLGTGLDRNVEGSFEYMVEMINNYAKHVISIDIPSGVHSDTGQIMGCAVRANETVTLGYPKIGLFVHPGAAYAGEIRMEDISLPAMLINEVNSEAEILTDQEAGQLMPKRGQRSNKSNFGRVVVFAGSNEMPGAAALASSAALAVGGGLVCACVIPYVATVVHYTQREIVTRIVSEKNGMYSRKSLETIMDEIERASVIIVGPGIGRNPSVTEFVHELISVSTAPLVLDADALYAVAENVNVLKTLKAPCVITPHPGEMSRLTGLTIPDILENTINVTTEFSKEFNVVTLLKDARTIVANPDNYFYINTTGNNALSKAGTGDVLTGMIAGFAAQGSDLFTASILGAFIHGKAGDMASAGKSPYGVMATDVIDNTPYIINECCKAQERLI